MSEVSDSGALSPLPTTAARLAVVLVSPKTPGNIGAGARAMLNMGASDLRLVAPRCDHLSGEAVAFAVHAEGVLRSARLYDTLSDALADRDLSIGTTARHRADLPDPQHPALLRPLVQASHAPALVFGPEESGLSNEDLELCQLSVRVPTAEYASLNLAQAVLLVCYEFLQGQGTGQAGIPEQLQPGPRKLATRFEMDGLYAHLRDTMLITGYSDEVRVTHTLRLWRTWLDRAHLNSAETRLFRGLLRQVRWKINESRTLAQLPPLPPALLRPGDVQDDVPDTGD
ncbi:RNA methyltransferase [Deinococcus sp. KNUC1210]|uniref:RNA methyltransferase n=1 Tax=Deinococcus sp. KNUC1210 TaxID=2917691 RepID=UPI001EF060FA|nr:RNA methyltransferase [Deinococcus sp. KNUC1210]ULH15647.1 RNA methyltransferase [Deinococcus sp. KNUC1210]